LTLVSGYSNFDTETNNPQMASLIPGFEYDICLR